MKSGSKSIPIMDRLSKRLLVMPSGCWEWQGYRTPAGYGRIWQNVIKETIPTHRAMWEIVFGPIPDGKCVLHKCDNPPCCNPAHLWLGTHTDNAADKVAKGRHAKGEKAGGAKLTLSDVESIRVDPRLHRVIAAEFGIVRQNVSMIKCGERWREEAPPT